MRKTIVIGGPTASGKSQLAMGIAQAIGGEIVSADSMQIYKYMNIGTAKPKAADTHLVPHHMIDFLDPGQRYSVARFGEQAYQCVVDIDAAGKHPIVCGGTGLYINALIRGNDFLGGAEDTDLRTRLEGEYDSLGGQAMHQRLCVVDPESGQRLHPNDKKRIVRALQVFMLYGITISQHNAQTQSKPDRLQSIKICLNPTPREFLYERINARVDIMMEDGLLAEATDLYNKGFLSGTAGQAIGYKEMLGHITRGEPLNQCVELLKQKSRNYAKRQLTWFSNQPHIEWFNFHKDTNFDDVIQKATKFLIANGVE